jgi:serine/threonine protein kinase
MSSALAYLATQGIVHKDVKPGNISYSYRRGAVLLDFGIASYSSTSTKDEGGTPWYIPPEYLINRSRGFTGDIWALGVTLLYLLGAIPLPDKYAGDWDIVNAYKQHGPDRGHMELWIGKIESIRQNLCQVEEWNGVKALVAKMLDNKPQERVTAARLETLAMNLE